MDFPVIAGVVLFQVLGLGGLILLAVRRARRAGPPAESMRTLLERRFGPVWGSKLDGLAAVLEGRAVRLRYLPHPTGSLRDQDLELTVDLAGLVEPRLRVAGPRRGVKDGEQDFARSFAVEDATYLLLDVFRDPQVQARLLTLAQNTTEVTLFRARLQAIRASSGWTPQTAGAFVEDALGVVRAISRAREELIQAHFARGQGEESPG